MKREIIFYGGIIVTAIIVILSVVIGLQHQKIKRIQDDLSVAIINNKAYEAENDSLVNKNIEFNFTVEQLNHSQDSLVQLLNKTRKELKVKDKNIEELQYLASHTSKTDSIFVRDTIFRDNGFELDTTIADEWAKLQLHLKYPNLINTEYSFKNETIIVSSSRRETIEPPHKCWLIRLFQKKHTITDVEVIQNNPYCENDLHKHIKIVN